MAYKISGTKSETARVMVFKESDWSIESNTVISGSGAYEVDGLETGAKTVLSTSNESEMLGFGNVIPIEVEASGGEFERSYLNPATEKTNSAFGSSLAATDTYLVIGAPGQESDPEAIIRSGQVHLYNPTTGVLQGTIENPNASGTKQEDWFGYSVALTDTYLLVGGNDPYNDGMVYKFNTATRALLDTWTQPGDAYYGTSVDISPNSSYAIVGDYGAVSRDGEAYIYDAVTGNLLHTLDNPLEPPGSNDDFGYAVAINNTYAVVGAPNEDGDFNSTGGIHVYLVATGALLWSIPSPNQEAASGFFGDVLSINDDNKIVVSAKGATVDAVYKSGEAYIYDAVTGNLLHTLDNPNPVDTARWDSFGGAVDISDTHVVIGAHAEDYTTHTASPDQTEWLFEDNFADLTNLSSREYIDGFWNCVSDTVGENNMQSLNDPDYQQYVMHDLINDKYYTMDWSSWGADDGGSFAYTRQQVHATTGASIGAPVVFSHSGIDDPDLETDLVDTGLEITRDSYYGLFNRLLEVDEHRDTDWPDNSGKAYVFDVATGALVYTFDNPHGQVISGYFGEFATINSTRAFVAMMNEGKQDSPSIDEVSSYTL